jgi:hypothetical protein
MGELKPTGFSGQITWLGRVPEARDLLWAEPCERLSASFAGPVGDLHLGLTRPSCSRMTGQYARGTEIRNSRQFSVLSDENLAEIAAIMGLASLSPGLLGATMVLRGIPDLSHLPPGSRLQGPTGATLVVNLNNRPCTIPARAIETAHPGFGAKFKPAAQGRRGITAWVEREGILALGDELRLHVPEQRPWAHLAAALAG